MKLLLGGLALFIFWLANLIFLPRLIFTELAPVPAWYDILQFIIGFGFMVLGVSAIGFSKKYVAGILFFLLGIIAIITDGLIHMWDSL